MLFQQIPMLWASGMTLLKMKMDWRTFQKMSGCKNITFPICGTTQILTGPEDPCCHFVARLAYQFVFPSDWLYVCLSIFRMAAMQFLSRGVRIFHISAYISGYTRYIWSKYLNREVFSDWRELILHLVLLTYLDTLYSVIWFSIYSVVW